MNNKPQLILLVDDDEDDIFFHRRAITNSGLTCQIDVCTSGDTAMDYLTNQGEYATRGTKNKQPDLIFLDINMPRVDGWTFLDLYGQWIEESEFDTPAIVVMLSTSIYSSDAERAEASPIVSKYVSKPLKPDCIVKLITSLFS